MVLTGALEAYATASRNLSCTAWMPNWSLLIISVTTALITLVYWHTYPGSHRHCSWLELDAADVVPLGHGDFIVGVGQ